MSTKTKLFNDKHVEAVTLALASNKSYDISNASMVVCTHLVLNAMGITNDVKRRDIIAQISNGNRLKQALGSINRGFIVGIFEQLLAGFDSAVAGAKSVKGTDDLYIPFITFTKNNEIAIPLVANPITTAKNLSENFATLYSVNVQRLYNQHRNGTVSSSDSSDGDGEAKSFNINAENQAEIIKLFAQSLDAGLPKDRFWIEIEAEDIGEVNTNIRHSTELGDIILNDYKEGGSAIPVAEMRKALTTIISRVSDEALVPTVPQLSSFID